jgi:hypothetical protein
MGLKRGLLRVMSSIEELLERQGSGFGACTATVSTPLRVYLTAVNPSPQTSAAMRCNLMH